MYFLAPIMDLIGVGRIVVWYGNHALCDQSVNKEPMPPWLWPQVPHSLVSKQCGTNVFITSIIHP